MEIIQRTGKLFFALGLVLIFCLAYSYRNPAGTEPRKTDPNVLLTSPAADGVVGFNGATPARITLDPDTGTIKSIDFLDNAEDPDHWEQVLKSGIFAKYLGRTPQEAVSLPVDAVTGATFSAHAAQETLRKRLMLAADIKPEARISAVKFNWTDLLVLAVLAGNLAFFLLRRGGKLRFWLLAVNTLVLGFAACSYLSFAQIAGWLAVTPLNWRLSINLALFLLTVVLALTTRRNFYCSTVCPYGCAQELAGHLGKKCRIKPVTATFRYGPYIRRALAAAGILLLLCGIRFRPYEPFHVFSLHASWWVTVLAVLFILASLFKPRLWCQWLCPCGATLDFFSRRDPEPQTQGKKMTYERLLVLLMLVVVVIALLRPLPQTQPAAPATATESGKPDVLTVIHQRKSVRTYTSEPVTMDELNMLVKAGFAAPSAGNRGPWEFIIVTDRAKLDAIATIPTARALGKAPAAIVVCGNPANFLPGDAADMWIEDCSAATQNILLAAEGSGLGAVWLGFYPLKDRMAIVTKTLNLPPEIIPLCVISIGRPTGAEKPKDKFDAKKIHLQDW